MFDTIVVNPLTNALIACYELVGNNLGWAIILFTIVLRFILLPLTMRQIKQQKKMQDLQPQLQKLQSKRKDASQMSPEEVALMRQTAGSCLGGCLPILLQIPILIGLNIVIGNIAGVNADPNRGGDFFNNILWFDWLKHSSDYVFNTIFAGFDLAKHPSSVPLGWDFLPYGILLVILVVSQFIQSLLMNSQQAQTAAKNKPNQKKLSKEEQEKQEMQEMTQKWTRLQMVYLLPLMVGFGAYSFSAALGLYWTVQNLFALVQTIIQYRMMNHRLGWNETKEDLSRFFNKLMRWDFRKKDENPVLQAIEVLEGESTSKPASKGASKRNSPKKSKKSKKKRR